LFDILQELRRFINFRSSARNMVSVSEMIIIIIIIIIIMIIIIIIIIFNNI